MKTGMKTFHRFLDEAGDSTFYGKGKIPIVGNEGVSNYFIIGMVSFSTKLPGLRNQIITVAKAGGGQSLF